jgi:hypothetical protein
MSIPRMRSLIAAHSSREWTAQTVQHRRAKRVDPP